MARTTMGGRRFSRSFGWPRESMAGRSRDQAWLRASSVPSGVCYSSPCRPRAACRSVSAPSTRCRAGVASPRTGPHPFPAVGASSHPCALGDACDRAVGHGRARDLRAGRTDPGRGYRFGAGSLPARQLGASACSDLTADVRSRRTCSRFLDDVELEHVRAMSAPSRRVSGAPLVAIYYKGS